MRVWSLVDFDPGRWRSRSPIRRKSTRRQRSSWTRRSLLRLPLDLVTCLRAARWPARQAQPSPCSAQADAPVPPQSRVQPPRVGNLDAANAIQLAMVADNRVVNSTGSSAASGCSGTIASTMPLRSRSADRMPCAAASSGAWSMSRKTIALAPFRRQRGQPAVQRGQHPVGGHHRQRRPAAALAEQHRHRRGVQRDEIGQAAGDLAGQAVLLGLGRQRRSGGVDDQHQRQLQARRPAPCRGAPPAARPGRPIPPTTRCCPSTTAGWPPNRASASSVVAPRRGRAGQQHPFGGAVPQQIARPRAGPAGARPPPTPTPARRAPARRRASGGGGTGRVGDDLQRAVQRRAQPPRAGRRRR